MARGTWTHSIPKGTRARMLALALAVCLVLASVLFSALLFLHGNHEHDHHGPHGCCAACAQLQNAESVLKQLGTALAGSALVLAGLRAAPALLREMPSAHLLPTPVALKIQMNC